VEKRSRTSRPRTVLLLAALLLAMCPPCRGAASAAPPPGDDRSQSSRPAPDYGKLPLSFVPNAGQLEARVGYYHRGAGRAVYFGRDEVVFDLRKAGGTAQAARATLALRFIGARHVAPEGEQQDLGRVNHIVGNDPAKWRLDLPTYREIVYRDLWPGVQLRFQGVENRLKYELVLAPGASVQAIRLAYRGASSLALDDAGNLRIGTRVGVLTDERPTAYQEIDGRRVPVSTRFVLSRGADGGRRLGFSVAAAYDARHPLVIDPGLAYSTYLGGTGADAASAIAIDGAGNAYVAGTTESPSFPVTTGPAFKGGSKSRGVTDAFVAKLNAAGSGLVWATFLGGSDADVGYGIAVDPSGHAYVTGSTYSADFPTTVSAYRRKVSGNADLFLARLDDQGHLAYSTFFGGGGFDAGLAVAVDSTGHAYVTGQTLSSNVPVNNGPFASAQGKSDAVVAKFDTFASGPASLVWSTYLGGTGNDVGRGIAADVAGNAYVTGETASANFRPRRRQASHRSPPSRALAQTPSSPG